MLRRLLPALPFCLWALAGSALAQGCEPIRFAAGASSAEVSGLAPADGMVCRSVAVGDGQRARVRVLEGRGIAFSVEGRIDAQEDYAFVTERGTYRILVFQLMRAVVPEPFLIEVSVTGGRVEVPEGWRLDEGDGRATGLAWLGAEGGASVAMSCAAAPEPRLALVFDGVEAAALDGPAEEAQGWIEIAVGAAPRRHPVRLAFSDGFDPFWTVTEGLSPPLLEDFARGSALRLLDGEGRVAGEVELAGSARLREAIARRCGI